MSNDINILNNTGKTTPLTNPGGVASIKSGVDKQAALAQASTAAQGTDNNIPANAQSGVRPATPSPASTANNGVPVETDLSRIVSKGRKQEFLEPGNSINYKNEITGLPPDTIFKGTPSLFNDYWLIRYHSISDRVSGENPIVTNLGKERNYLGLADSEEYKNPTTSKIVEVFNGDGDKGFSVPEKKYSYSDFLYLKHYHPHNNNRLITLRRYIVPVYDNCMTVTADGPEKRVRYPVAKALSYLGTSDNKLSTVGGNFTVSINSTNTKGQGDGSNATIIGADEFANMKNFLGGDNNSTQNGSTFFYGLLKSLSGDTDIDETTAQKWATALNPWQSGTYGDLVNGPVNVIEGARIRQRGLAYTQQINLNFEYSTKYIERVNPKAAMLDIIANMLSMSYHHASFWGGENRFILNRSNFPWKGQEIGIEFLKALGTGNSDAEALRKYTEELAKTGGKTADNVKALVEAFGKGREGLRDPAVAELVKNATTVASTLNKQMQGLNKTIVQGTKATINGSPTGEWHLQVGNPFAPMMMIGNLWCTSAVFNFNDDLSADDFPTELKVTLKLDFGQPRDASSVQSMFNAGGGRIYYPYPSGKDVNASSTFYNTEYIYDIKPSETLGAYNSQTKTSDGTQIAGGAFSNQQSTSNKSTSNPVEKLTNTKVATEFYQSKNYNEIKE